jgi:hypothetical protein
MKAVLGIITALAGFLGIIGSAIAIRYWLIVIVIMSILKLGGLVQMAWFAGIFSAGAISTGLFMLFGGLILIIISFFITAIGSAILEDQ